ncbi:MAG: RloB domain-containing protein [Oscillospiraceae bacterium]
MLERASKFRLSSSAFERADDTDKVLPKKMIFLSVEGDETERTYFEHLNEFLDLSLIQIEVLRHKRGDGYSDPEHVIELLDEYINVRNGELVPDSLMKTLYEKYTSEDLQKYLSEDITLNLSLRKAIKAELLKIGIDFEYRYYLQSFDKETDYFAIVLDRDCGNHDRQLLEECIQFCSKKNYGCFITNPCFEFWLLLHLCDVAKEFTPEEQNKLLVNAVVSNKHTETSLAVSKRAHHTKAICSSKFKQYYYSNIKLAIQRSKTFATEFPELLDNLGSNLSELFKEFNF